MHNTLTSETWTEARISRLKALWAAGMSCAQIAADLGCFKHCSDGGRRAVIGKIHRLKLPHPEGKKVTRNTNPRPAVPATTRLRNGYDPALRRNPSHNILAAIAIAGNEPGLPEKFKGEAPDGTGIGLLDLDASTCRWPRGNPTEPNFEFCGAYALKDKPYCAHHCRLAYEPPKTRARQDKWSLLGADTQS